MLSRLVRFWRRTIRHDYKLATLPEQSLEARRLKSPQGRLKVELIVGEAAGAKRRLIFFAQYAQVASRPGESQVALLEISQTQKIVAPLANI